MEKPDVKKLNSGLYKIYWKEGGSSLAAIGVTPKGNMWMAPTNWCEISTNQINGDGEYTWVDVEKVEQLTQINADNAFIICCNDSTELIVTGSEEKANEHLNILKTQDKISDRWKHTSQEDYDNMLFWHLHEVKIV